MARETDPVPTERSADLELLSRPVHGRTRWPESPACGSHEFSRPTPDESRREPPPDLVCFACGSPSERAQTARWCRFTAQARAERLLGAHRAELDRLFALLEERETLDPGRIEAALGGARGAVAAKR